MDTNYLKFYDLESYLLNDVRVKFQNTGVLTVEEFFCIIIWKSNRSKSRIADNLKNRNSGNLADAVNTLCKELYKATSDKDRFKILFDTWGFYPAVGSAILSILYPDQFTVYDYRVCETSEAFKQFKTLSNIENFEIFWPKYVAYKQAVIDNSPVCLSLRDKDRWLWGKSFAVQLHEEAKAGFPLPEKQHNP